MIRSEFLKAVQFASQAVSTRSTLPILETLRIKAKDGVGEVCGTNLDLFASHTFPCDVDLECCVAAKRLLRFLTNCADDSITVSHDGKKLTIRADRSVTNFDTLDASEFPPGIASEGEPFPIPGEAIKKCLPTVCTDTTRMSLCAVFLDKTGYAVATDGRRFHSVKIPAAKDDAIIPTAAASLLAGLEGEMRVSEKHFAASGDGWSVNGKLIEGTYPKWQMTTPKKKFTKEVPASLVDDLLSAIQSCEDVNIGRATFEKGNIVMPGHTLECGLDFGFQLCVNPLYLSQAIKAAGDGAEIGYSDEVSPITVSRGDFQAVMAVMRPQS